MALARSLVDLLENDLRAVGAQHWRYALVLLLVASRMLVPSFVSSLCGNLVHTTIVKMWRFFLKLATNFLPCQNGGVRFGAVHFGMCGVKLYRDLYMTL